MKVLRSSLFVLGLTCSPFVLATDPSDINEPKIQRTYSNGGFGLKQQLKEAVAKQNEGDVRYLLNLGAKTNLDPTDPDQEGLLHKAVHLNSLEIVKLLVEEGRMDVNQEDRHGFKPLHYALMSEQKNAEDISLYLIEKGADLVKAVGEDKNLPLHLAAMKNFARVTDVILYKHPSQVDQRNRQEGDQDRHTALFLVSDQAETDLDAYKPIIRILVAAGADIHFQTSKSKRGKVKTVLDPKGYRSHRRDEVVNFLKEREKVREESYEKLRLAVVNKSSLLEVKAALTDGARLSGIYFRENRRKFYDYSRNTMVPYENGVQERLGNTIFHLAIKKGNQKFVEFAMNPIGFSQSDIDAGLVATLSATNHLSDQEVNMKNEKGETPLQVAINQGSYPIAKSLIDRIPEIKVDPSDKKNYPIHLAIRHNRADVVQFFLWNNPSSYKFLGLTDKRGYNTIHLAAELGRCDILELFVPVFDTYFYYRGSSILHSETPVKTSGKGSLKVVEGGDTPLHLAARGDYPECVRILLDKRRSDTFQHNAKGWTAWVEYRTTKGDPNEPGKLNPDQMTVRQLLKDTRKYGGKQKK